MHRTCLSICDEEIEMIRLLVFDVMRVVSFRNFAYNSVSWYNRIVWINIDQNILPLKAMVVRGAKNI